MGGSGGFDRKENRTRVYGYQGIQGILTTLYINAELQKPANTQTGVWGTLLFLGTILTKTCFFFLIFLFFLKIMQFCLTKMGSNRQKWFKIHIDVLNFTEDYLIRKKINRPTK